MQEWFPQNSMPPQEMGIVVPLHTNTSNDTTWMGCAVEPRATSLSISIVSNSQLLREGLTVLLSAHLNFQLIGSYAASDAINNEPWSLPNHVALIDGNIGLPTVAVWSQRWRKCVPPASVVVLELANDPTAILAFVEVGVSGYTLCGATGAEVVETIQHVCAGRVLCSPEVTAQLFNRLASLHADYNELSSSRHLLTQRELEVLRLIAADYNNKQIAAALVIEVRTVKHHVHNILDKLKLRHRWDAARLAVERGWASAEGDE